MYKAIIMYCLGILQLALISIVAATPTSQSNQRDVSLESATALSTLPDQPGDHDMATVLKFYPFDLPDIAVFMAAIRAMRELGSRDFEKDNIPETSWSHPLFPGVELTVAPPPAKELLSVRFAMWIIVYTIKCLIPEERYSGEFLTLYRREMIGYAITHPTVAIATQGNSSIQRTQHNDMNSFPLNSLAQNPDIETAANDDMQATVNYVGKNIDRATFFMALLSLMLNLAPRIGEPLTVWQATAHAINSEITVIWNRAKSPAGSPQSRVTKGDLLSMFARLPEICLHDKRFQEMNVEIRESGEVIARGLLRVKPRIGVLSGPLIVNDTIERTTAVDSIR